jgi:hypothetical protein
MDVDRVYYLGSLGTMQAVVQDTQSNLSTRLPNANSETQKRKGGFLARPPDGNSRFLS